MWRSEPIERTTTAPEFNPTGDLDEHALGPSHGLGVLLDRVLHPERRVASAHRMVLMCERSTEQGHDAVAHHLVHGALVTVDRLYHPLEHGIKKLSRFFRVPVDQQLHRALHVGEQNRDLLAFSFEGRPQDEDLAGEVLRHVGLGRTEP